jgi:hypothetical protein
LFGAIFSEILSISVDPGDFPDKYGRKIWQGRKASNSKRVLAPGIHGRAKTPSDPISPFWGRQAIELAPFDIRIGLGVKTKQHDYI